MIIIHTMKTLITFPNAHKGAFNRSYRAKIAKKDALRQATAKNAAIKAGKALSEAEMSNLVSDLLQCKQYTNNNAGKAIIVKLTKSSLERFFQ